MNLSVRDFINASVPGFAAITLSQLNSIVGIMGGLLGIAYLIWKWRKEAAK